MSSTEGARRGFVADVVHAGVIGQTRPAVEESWDALRKAASLRRLSLMAEVQPYHNVTADSDTTWEFGDGTE